MDFAVAGGYSALGDGLMLFLGSCMYLSYSGLVIRICTSIIPVVQLVSKLE